MSLIWFLGFIPGLAWLFIFLYRDRKNPEPKRMIGETFFYGALVTFIALGVEAIGFRQLGAISPLYIFLIVAPAEEILKWLTFRLKVQESANYDEPIDAMIYMITIALGFATVENIFLILREAGNPIDIIIMRFLSATLLHALASAIVGYFIGAKKPLVLGLVLAIFGHAIYNYFAIVGGGKGSLGIIIVLIIMFSAVSYCFKKIKN